MKRRLEGLWLTQIFMLVLIGGCAILPLKDPEESLRERVTQYMQARVDERWGDVYEFFDSAYKKSVSRDQFLGIPAKMDFTGFQIDSIEMNESEKEAAVSIKVDVSVQGFEFKGTPEKHTWIKQGGDWYIKVRTDTQPPFP